MSKTESTTEELVQLGRDRTCSYVVGWGCLGQSWGTREQWCTSVQTALHPDAFLSCELVHMG